jgi:hypothetical protein
MRCDQEEPRTNQKRSRGLAPKLERPEIRNLHSVRGSGVGSEMSFFDSSLMRAFLFRRALTRASRESARLMLSLHASPDATSLRARSVLYSSDFRSHLRAAPTNSSSQRSWLRGASQSLYVAGLIKAACSASRVVPATNAHRNRYIRICRLPNGQTPRAVQEADDSSARTTNTTRRSVLFWSCDPSMLIRNTSEKEFTPISRITQSEAKSMRFKLRLVYKSPQLYFRRHMHEGMHSPVICTTATLCVCVFMRSGKFFHAVFLDAEVRCS